MKDKKEILVPLQYVIDVHDCFSYLVERGLMDIHPFDQGSSALEMIEESKVILERVNNDE